LKLGSIGAQLGETINEFSSDPTLSGNSNLAIPTEAAVKSYVDTSIIADRVYVDAAIDAVTDYVDNTIDSAVPEQFRFTNRIVAGQVKTLLPGCLAFSYEALTLEDTANYTISPGSVHQLIS
jgi:hypothetical protein